MSIRSSSLNDAVLIRRFITAVAVFRNVDGDIAIALTDFRSVFRIHFG